MRPLAGYNRQPFEPTSLTIYDVARCVLKDRRSDPGLEDKPTAKVDTSDLVFSKSETQVTFADAGHSVRRSCMTNGCKQRNCCHR